MKNTINYALKKPEGADVVNVDDFNGNADIIDKKLKELELNEIFYAVATGSANTYTVTIPALSSLTGYFDGLAVCVKINIPSTGASTLNVNGWGAKTIVDSLGNQITSGGLKIMTPYTLRYNGVVFILQGKGGGGNVTADKLLIGYNATGDTGQVNGAMANNGTINITPGATAKSIPKGYTEGGTVAGDSNLISDYILGTKSIFGVQGKSSVVDTADALATASQLLSGVSAYVNGLKVTGLMPNQPSSVNVLSVGTSTYSPNNRYFRIPPGAYITNASSGYPEVVATASQIDSSIISSNIKSGAKIIGVSGSPSVVDTADALATANQLLSGVTAYVNGAKITGNIPSRGATTITPGTANQTIASGQFLSGVQTIAGDPGLNPNNIVSGSSIFGVQGAVVPAPVFDSIYTKIASWDYKCSPLPTPRGCLKAIYYKNKIYTFGGMVTQSGTNNMPVNTVEIFDIYSNTWTTGTAMPRARSWTVCELYNGKVYITCGNNGTLDIYDIESNTWTTGTACPWAGNYVGSAVYNGKMYVFGGLYGSNCPSYTYIYDIASNTWSSAPTYAYYQMGYALDNGIIYATGGLNNAGSLQYLISKFDTFNPGAGWVNTGAYMNSSRNYHTSWAYNGKLYSTGGMTSNSNTLATTSEMMNESTKVNTVLPGIPTPRIGSCVVMVGNYAYIIGGFTIGSPTYTYFNNVDVMSLI